MEFIIILMILGYLFYEEKEDKYYNVDKYDTLIG